MKQGVNQDKFRYITEGPILSSMVKLSLPIMISQLMQTLYNLADTLWVGRVGADAVAAISISFPIVFLMISVAAGLTIAGTALIAQYKGAGRHERVDEVLGQLFSFIGVLSILLAIVGLLISKSVLIWMGAEANIIADATNYLRIIFVGMPFMFTFFIFSATLRGIGDTITPTIMMVTSVVLNIVLDPLLIFGIGPFPELGVLGAAVATIFSRAVVSVAGLHILLKGTKGIHLKGKNMRPNWETIKLIVRIGLPSSVEQSMMSIGQILMTSLVASFGTMTVAAYGIVNRVISLPRILAFGLSAAATTMVGQNVGADKKDRAEKIASYSIGLIFISMTALGLVVSMAPRALVILFNDAPEVLRYGTSYLRIVSYTFGFIGVMTVANGVFKGAGKTIPPMVISTLSLWILRVPLGHVLANYLGWNQQGLWWAVAISDVGGAFLGITWLKLSDWSKKVIKTEPKPIELEIQGE